MIQLNLNAPTWPKAPGRPALKPAIDQDLSTSEKFAIGGAGFMGIVPGFNVCLNSRFGSLAGEHIAESCSTNLGPVGQQAAKVVGKLVGGTLGFASAVLGSAAMMAPGLAPVGLLISSGFAGVAYKLALDYGHDFVQAQADQAYLEAEKLVTSEGPVRDFRYDQEKAHFQLASGEWLCADSIPGSTTVSAPHGILEVENRENEVSPKGVKQWVEPGGRMSALFMEPGAHLMIVSESPGILSGARLIVPNASQAVPVSAQFNQRGQVEAVGRTFDLPLPSQRVWGS